MRRRAFIAALGGIVAWPLAARAQQSTIPVIGFLSTSSPEPYAHLVAKFRQALNDAGFVEGQNVSMEYRWAQGQYDQLPNLAAELVRRRVAVLMASGGSVSAQAAKSATSTIPIVFTTGIDPVKFGLVASFNRPGGNLTGIAFLGRLLGKKRLELLRGLVPKAAVIAILVNPNNPTTEPDVSEVTAAVLAGGQQIVILNARSEGELDAAFAALVHHNADALFVNGDPFFNSRQDQIVALAARYAIPTGFNTRAFAEAGGLMSYGANLSDAYWQAGAYVAQILKGAKPADLPILQPTKFELVINLKTAKTLGLEVPPSLIAIADEVIE